MGPFAASVVDSLELLEGAGAAFDPELVARGLQSPTFFGSARSPTTACCPSSIVSSNWRRRPRPAPPTRGPIDPVAHPFSGFVFKIQANMDPDHRDRVAFLRVCSGHFVRGETALHVRSGKPVRLTRSTLLQAQEREIVDEAYPGDVVGLFDPGVFRIGDTLSVEGDFALRRHPEFLARAFLARRSGAGAEPQGAREGADAALAGRRRADLHRARLGFRGDDPRRRRPAAIRGAPAPPASRVRRRAEADAAAATSSRAGRARASTPRRSATPSR